MQCLSKSTASTETGEPFVRIYLKTTQPVCVRKIEQTEFCVERYMTNEKICKIYYVYRKTKEVEEIDIFHMHFPFVVVEEPLIDYESTLNGYDLRRMWWNAFGLDEATKMANVGQVSLKEVQIKFAEEMFNHEKVDRDEERAILTKWCSLELAMLEKRNPALKEKMRNLESLAPNETRDDMRRDVTITYKKTIHQLQADQLLINHRGQCVQFEKQQILIRALMDKVLDVPAECLEAEEALNGKIATMFTSLLPPLNKHVDTCRASQLFKTNRQVFLRKCTQLSQLGIDANTINNVSKRNKLEIIVKSHTNMMSTNRLKAFDCLQKEYSYCCVELGKINEQHQTGRRQFVEHIERKYHAMIEK